MPNLYIFASFEFDKDKKLRGDFYGQAKTLTPHRVRDKSLDEAYPAQEWESKAENAIRECDVVVVLVGPDTHNADGVAKEVKIARALKKPVLQIRPRKWTCGGVPGLDEPMRWKWKRINAELEKVTSQLGRR